MANVNSFESAAVSIDGARHRGALWRNLAYAATNGAEGVVAPGDCKPRQLLVPGPQVRLDSGAVVIRVKAANIDNQSYIANNTAETRLDVASTGATKRSDLVVVRIKDPQYGQWSNPAAGTAPDFQYVEPFIIQNVPETTTSFGDLNLSYSAYALARLDLPPNTINVGTDMIKGLRRVCNQRRESWFGRFDHGATTQDSPTSGETYIRFPASTFPQAQIPIPSWATKAKIRVDITGLSHLSGGYRGNWRWHLTDNTGNFVDTKTTWAAENTPGDQKLSYLVSDLIDVPDTLRDKTVTGYLQFAREATASTGFFRADTNTAVSVDIDFIGAAI